MSTSNQTKVTRQVHIGQIIAGIEKYFSKLPVIPLGGANVTPAALVERLQQVVDVIQKSSNAKAAWLAAVQTERNSIGELGQVLRYIKAFVITQFGELKDASQKLEEFGYTPRKVRSKDVAVKAGAADKARGTRKARGTGGKKQKAPIKGTPIPKTPKSVAAVTGAAPAAPTAPAPVKPAS